MSDLHPHVWAVYRRLRGLGDYVPISLPKDMSARVLKRRADQITAIEKEYPDIRATYNRLPHLEGGHNR